MSIYWILIIDSMHFSFSERFYPSCCRQREFGYPMDSTGEHDFVVSGFVVLRQRRIIKSKVNSSASHNKPYRKHFKDSTAARSLSSLSLSLSMCLFFTVRSTFVDAMESSFSFFQCLLKDTWRSFPASRQVIVRLLSHF